MHLLITLHKLGLLCCARLYFYKRCPFRAFVGFSWSVVDDRDDHQDGGGVHNGHSDHQKKSTRYESSLIKIKQFTTFFLSRNKNCKFLTMGGRTI